MHERRKDSQIKLHLTPRWSSPNPRNVSSDFSTIVTAKIPINDISMEDPKGHVQVDAHEEHLQCAAQAGIDKTKRYNYRSLTSKEAQPIRLLKWDSHRTAIKELYQSQTPNETRYQAISHIRGQPKDGDPDVREKNLEGQSVPHIITRDPLAETHEELHPRYKVLENWKFKWGRVFKVHWPEPKGSGNDPIDTVVHPTTYSKVRRFVVTSNVKGHCLCLPINTYARQGITKNGVHTKDHAVIYSDSASLSLLGGEKIKHKDMSKCGFDEYSDSRHANQSTTQEKLISRAEHHNLYTVEHNVKVKVVGDVEVHHDSKNEVTSITEQNADTDPDIETKVKSQYSRGKVCKECNGFLHTNEDYSYLRRPHTLNWSPKTHGIANLGCALGMGGTYLWLNKTMGLNPLTESMKWVLDKTSNLIPSILQDLPNPPGWAIFILFAACTVTFTGITFLWGNNRVQKQIAKEIACMIAMIGIVVCMLAGFGAEEIVLVGMPVSMSLGILASCAVRYRADEQKEWKEEKRGLVLEV